MNFIKNEGDNNEKNQLMLTFKYLKLTDTPGVVDYTLTSYDVSLLPDDFVIIKTDFCAIGPYDINIMHHRRKSSNIKNSFGFEGCGIIEYCGKSIDKSNLNKKCAFMAVDSVFNAYSEYSIVNFSNVVILKDDIEKNIYMQSAYFAGNPLTAKGLFKEKILNENVKSFILDTANSSLGKMIIKLANKNNIKVISVVRKDESLKELSKISDNCLNSSDKNFLTDLDVKIKELNPKLYITFLGGNLPTQIFALLPNKSELLVMGNINNELIQGFSSVPFIFQEKSISGYSVFGYLNDLIQNKTLSQETQEIFEDEAFKIDISDDNTLFNLSEFVKGAEYSEKSKGKIFFVPDHK